MEPENKDRAGEFISTAETEVISLLEEDFSIEKRQISAGKVRIRTMSESFEQVARATLEGESVDVVRVPIDRVVEVAPQTRSENGVTIVPILEEVLFVEKRLVLKEELHIRRQATTESVEVPVTLRRQRAVVERVAGGEDFQPSQEKLDGL